MKIEFTKKQLQEQRLKKSLNEIWNRFHKGEKKMVKQKTMKNVKLTEVSALLFAKFKLDNKDYSSAEICKILGRMYATALKLKAQAEIINDKI
jgi:hypothetical protein